MNDNSPAPHPKAEVVSLFDGPVPAQDASEVVDAELVSLLEELLKQARTGAVVGMVYVATHNDLATQSGWIGAIERMSSLGELDVLRHRIVASVIDEDDGGV